MACRLTVCVTGAGVGLNSVWEQEKLEVRKMLENAVVSASLRGVTAIMLGVIARDDHMEDYETTVFIREGAYFVGFGAELAKEAFEQIG